MKRTLTAIALVVAFTIGPNLPAEAHHRPGPCSVHWVKEWRENRNVEPIKAIIRCAVGRWPVPGGSAKALSVAACESGFRPNAYGNGNAGVYQHRQPYWEGRYDTYTRRRWHLYTSVYNGRTNVIVSIRMAHVYGWGAWSCA